MKRRDHEVEAEMRFHIDMEAAELERMGYSRDEARRKALASFGGVQRYKEEARASSWVEDLVRDLKYTFRSISRTRGYAAVVILTLALGIAANTSIFSVANGILFKPLPYRDPARLMMLWDGLDWVGVPEAWVTGPEYVQLRREMKTFEGFAAMRSGSVTLAGDGSEPQQIRSSTVSANFFQLLGAGPDIGRGFVPGDDAPGAPRVAVLSRGVWKQRYGADTSIIGKSIIVDGLPTTLLGVLPQNFHFAAQTSLGAPSDAEIYVPLTDTLDRLPRGNHSIGVLARVRSDLPVARGVAELAAISKRIDSLNYGKQGFKYVPIILQERMVREVRPALIALLAAVGMLVLIMAANLAVLALVRAARREREITVRRAIGASTSRITRQILTETVLLAIVSAVVGAVMGSWMLRGLLSIAPAGLPRRNEIGIDLLVLAVTLGVAIAVGVAMALAPVFHSVRSDISTVLREKASSRTGSRVRHSLVLAQLALSMVLLAGTGLLLGSFLKLMRVDPGFRADHVLTMDMMASRTRHTSGAQVVALWERYAEALRALPGVTAVGATSAPPLSQGADQSGLRFPSSPTNTGEGNHDFLLVDVMPATRGYFDAMGIQVLEGRGLELADNDSSAKVAIIDDVVAQRYFPKGSAIGQIALLDNDSLRVVGVVRHVRMYNLQEEGRGQMYVSHGRTAYRYLTVAIRTQNDPLSMATSARRAIRAIDPDQAIVNVGVMTDAVRNSLAERRLVLTLVGAFASAALLLAALGVYGVTANTVTQRTRELGIRMALGADRRKVIWAVLAEPAKLVTLGLVVGLAGTLAAGRVVQRLLYGVSPTDPLTLVAVAIVLLLVALLASYFPARRATRVDPMIALRAE